MRIGSLDRPIQLQRLVRTQDETGAENEAWATFVSTFANIKHLSGLETVRSEVPISVVKASIRIRLRDDVDATCRVLYRGTIYDIKAVMPDLESREYLDLACEAGQNNG